MKKKINLEKEFKDKKIVSILFYLDNIVLWLKLQKDVPFTKKDFHVICRGFQTKEIDALLSEMRRPNTDMISYFGELDIKEAQTLIDRVNKASKSYEFWGAINEAYIEKEKK